MNDQRRLRLLSQIVIVLFYLSNGVVSFLPGTKGCRIRATLSINSSNQINPFSEDSGRPSKADLYSNDDLEELLNLHTSIQPELEATSSKAPKEDAVPVPDGLHEAVLGTLASIESDEAIKPKALAIRAIASDVDGTLLRSDHSMSPITELAIQDAVQAAASPVQSLQHFFPATGKSRAGALTSLGPTIGPLLSKVPGVFIQGLYVVDADGEVIFEQKITKEEVAAAQALAEEYQVSLFGYDGDSMKCTTQSSEDHRQNFHSKFGEPLAAPMDDLTLHEPGFHKCLFMHDDELFLSDVLRPRLEKVASEYQAEVTQAVPYMLEWLPSGGSKANGVAKLCEHLGIDMETELLALGDAENDLEMLQQAAIGVSMGNAVPAAADAADVNMVETNNMGGAGIAIRKYGFGEVLQ